MCLVLFVGVTALPAVAGPPMSRGQQFYTISHQDCLARATGALQSAGYSVWGQLGNGPWGDRGPHSAVILCEPAAGNREVVLIVVATNGTSDPNVPGAERVRLQELMEGRTSSPQQPATCIGFQGRWDTRFGPVIMRVTGNRAEGDYVNYGGKVWGTITGNVLDGQYAVPDGRKGTFRWTLSADNRSTSGAYQDAGTPSNNGPWDATCGGGVALLQRSDAGPLQSAGGRLMLGVWRQQFANEQSVIEIRNDGTGVFREVSEEHARLGFRVGDVRLRDLREVAENTLQGQIVLRVPPSSGCETLPAVVAPATVRVLSAGRRFRVHADDYREGAGCQLVASGVETSIVYQREWSR